jgi:hypothetical protein
LTAIFSLKWVSVFYCTRIGQTKEGRARRFEKRWQLWQQQWQPARWFQVTVWVVYRLKIWLHCETISGILYTYWNILCDISCDHQFCSSPHSELHRQLANVNEKNGELHKRLESLHQEKIMALDEVTKEMRRAESEASKRRQAESRVRNMESDVG